MTRLNCWEFMRCGRESSCPASTQASAHGVNGGECAGRLCWSVAGTRCHGLDGTWADKRDVCNRCDFFHAVSREEGISFQLLEYDHSQAW